MEHAVGAALRWTRALLLSSVALVFGTVAHVAAGGLLPGTVALATLFLGCVGASAALLGRPASTLRVVLLLVGGQTAVHVALTGLAGHRGEHVVATPSPAVVATPDVPRVGSLYDQYAASVPTTGGGSGGSAASDALAHLVADLTGPHALMAVAHLVAAAIVGLWLAHGERTLWALLALLGAEVGGWLTALTALVVPPAPASPTPSARAETTLRVPHRLVLARAHSRRGPPVLLAG